MSGAKRTRVNQRASRTAGAEMRERLSVIALECFVERGPTQTTLVEIARRAKVRVSLVHYYFPTNQALLGEIVNRVVEIFRSETLAPLVDVKAHPAKVLEDYVRAHFRVASKNRELFSVWLFFNYQASYTAEFRELNTRLRVQGRERIEGMLYRGVAQGVFRLPRSTDVPELALEIQALIFGAWFMPLTEYQCTFKAMAELTVARVLSLTQTTKR